MSSIRTALTDAVVAALPVAVVYFAGWAYLSNYLGQFGIDATQVEINFTTVLVYAFIPLQSPWIIGFLIVCGVAIYYVSSRATLSNQAKSRWAALAVIALALFLFLVKWAASGKAAEMADHVWRGDKSQTFMILTEPEKPDWYYELYQICRTERRLRQVIGLTDRMFLLCRSASMPCAAGTMFAINNEGAIIYVTDKSREDNICAK